MSEGKKTVTEEVKEPTSAIQPEPGVVVYIGPTIIGVASHSTVFNNGLPETLKAATEREPAFKGLVIPVSRLAAALKEIETKSGATYALYVKVADYKVQEG